MGKRFEDGESGQQLGDETELGTLVVPNLWGAEVVQRSFGGGRANDRLVPNLLPSTHPRARNPMSARQLLILNLYETFLVRPTRTLAHPTPLSLATNMPQAQTRTQTSSSSPLRSLAPVHVLLPRLPLPPRRLRVVRRDGAQLRSVAGKRFDAERMRLGRGDVGGGLVGIR